MGKCCSDLLWGSVAGMWGSVVWRSVENRCCEGVVEKCCEGVVKWCRDVLWGSVVKRSVVEKCCRDVL